MASELVTVGGPQELLGELLRASQADAAVAESIDTIDILSVVEDQIVKVAATVGRAGQRVERDAVGHDVLTAGAQALTAAALSLGLDVTGPSALWLLDVGAADAVALVDGDRVTGAGPAAAVRRLGDIARALSTCSMAELNTDRYRVCALRRGDRWFAVEVGDRSDAAKLVDAWLATGAAAGRSPSPAGHERGLALSGS